MKYLKRILSSLWSSMSSVGRAFSLALTLVAAAVSLSSPTLADVVKERQEIMKAVGQAAKLAQNMASGKLPFDPARAKGAMRTISDAPDKFVKLFPTGSHTDPETAASPAIWKNMADFLSKAQKLKRVSSEVAAAAAQGEAAFRIAFDKLSRVCKDCHQSYKLKKR